MRKINHKNGIRKLYKQIYPNVPITLVVIWLSPDSSSLAKPKSETLALNSSLINMLLDFMSRCTTLGSIASCR